ncbi:mono [ADP-ribose] polymerase PARP16 isoform X1 [Sicyoidochytrium minutum DNA virus]|nr:mono [ADP-ribose] polymerase PARP16 isoform X1 [Sicyoidochytrium minutum DNA virus]
MADISYDPNLSVLALSDPDFDRVAANMPNCCVVRIWRVVKQWPEYEEKLRSLDEGHITTLYHGTRAENVSSIVEEGLRAKHNQRSAFGRGTYFSSEINLSLYSYTDIAKGLSYVFVCDVIKEFAKRGSGSIFVCAEDDVFAPRYVVAFHKLDRK